MTNETLTLELLKIIPKEQLNEVFSQIECDIEPEFMGFVSVYKSISEIIPKHWTILDLGCAYAPQCFYFKDHKKYIGVDIFKGVRFRTENTEHVISRISDYIEKQDLFKEETFAICSYVPQWGGDNLELTRKSFKNIFTYYPHGEFNPIVSFKNIDKVKGG